MAVLYNGSNCLRSLFASLRAIEIAMQMGEFEVIHYSTSSSEISLDQKILFTCEPVTQHGAADQVTTFEGSYWCQIPPSNDGLGVLP